MLNETEEDTAVMELPHPSGGEKEEISIHIEEQEYFREILNTLWASEVIILTIIFLGLSPIFPGLLSTLIYWLDKLFLKL